MTYEHLVTEHEDAVAILTINRPDALNALNRKVVSELGRAIEELEGKARVLVLTGAGGKAFVAGADIAEMAALEARDALAFSQAGHRLMRKLEQTHVPVIAAVGGFALGGGLELALACDFIYAAQTASFGQPEVALGVIPGFGGTQRLARRIGLGQARELIYTGRRIDAAEALRLGLINGVCEPAELMPTVLRIAAEIAQKAPLAVASAKRALGIDPEGITHAGNMAEAELFAALFETADQKEGMRAFVEKRKPSWTSS